MVDLADVQWVAMSLPDNEGEESSKRFGVNGIGFAWPYPEKVHPKRARVERLVIFVVRVADEDDKQAMLAGEPEKFFTTDHYDGYPAVLVRLAATKTDELTELLTETHAAARARKPRPR